MNHVANYHMFYFASLVLNFLILVIFSQIKLTRDKDSQKKKDFLGGGGRRNLDFKDLWVKRQVHGYKEGQQNQ